MNTNIEDSGDVSVIIPCYDCAAFVTRAIDSVLNQQYKNWELLLIDDGSTDNTRELLLRLANRMPGKIKVLGQKNLGAPAARNTGIANARGTYLQFLDSDDELNPGKLGEQVTLATALKADIIAGNFYKVFQNKKERVITRHKCLQHDLWLALATTGLGRTSSLLFRKEAVLKAGKWNEAQTSSQEYELLFRMFKNNSKVEFSKGFNTRIYLRNESIHLSKDPQKVLNVARNYIILRKKIKKHLQENGLFTSSFRRRFDHHLLGYLMNISHQLPEFYRQSLKELELQPTPSYYLKRWSRIVKQHFIP